MKFNINILKSLSISFDTTLSLLALLLSTNFLQGLDQLWIWFVVMCCLIAIEMGSGHSLGEFIVDIKVEGPPHRSTFTYLMRLVKSLTRWFIGILGFYISTLLLIPSDFDSLRVLMSIVVCLHMVLMLFVSPLIALLELRIGLNTLKMNHNPFWSEKLLLIPVLIGVTLQFLPHSSSHERSKVSVIRANMHTFQTMVETYAVDWHGHYPESVEILNQAANADEQSYWKEFYNPFVKASGQGQSFENELSNTLTMPPGMVTYVSLSPYTSYAIYGYDKQGSKILDKGKTYYLTNG